MDGDKKGRDSRKRKKQQDKRAKPRIRVRAERRGGLWERN